MAANEKREQDVAVATLIVLIHEIVERWQEE